ncbi:MAG TPA: class I SAM-dependent methyltransferase [Actinomycetota bacterium]|nr:class I SAM-dependent methyltransferase [Actinomycetota bacterium]
MPLYLGIAVVAGATIVYEVALTRIFSLAYGYHFAFLAMSLGLLGFGISGTLIALRPGWRENVDGARLGWLAAGASAAFAGGYLVANNIPLDPYKVGWDPGQLPLLAAYLTAYSLPFLLTGLVQGLAVTSWPSSAGRIYAAALGGSGAGGLLALPALDRLSSPAALTAASAAAAAASLVLARARPRVGVAAAARPRMLYATGIVLLAGLTILTIRSPGWMQVRVSEYKPLSQLLRYPDSEVALTANNAQSRIDVVDSSAVHSAPGLSPAYQGTLPSQGAAVIDGDRVLPLTATDDMDPRFLEALPSALAYRLAPEAQVLVLEPGGGLEVAAALDGRAASVTALESNPLLADLLTGPLAGRTGGIYNEPRVDLVAANPRAYLASTDRKFDVISLAVSENRRSVTAGAFSLSENFLLTRQAFDGYLDRLRPGGLLVIQRWLQLPPTEEIRTAALVVESLESAGREAQRHLVAIRSFSTMLILAKESPFTSEEVAEVRRFAAGGQYDLVHVPGSGPAATNRFNVLRNDRYAASFRSLVEDPDSFHEAYEYEVRPPSDDRPFFFHFFKWAQIPTVIALLGKTWQPFGGSGYLLVLGLLLVTTLLSALLILVPAVVIRRRSEAADRPGTGTARPAAYFAMLGLGFLMVEVALVGRFLLVLNHSALAFTLVLFGLLGFSGLGSWLSDRVPWRTALAGLVALVTVYALLLSVVLEALLGAPLALRIAAVVALLAPLGTLMGVAFPKGLSWLVTDRPAWVPMAWAVNGFTSVIGAVLAALLALSWGYSMVLACGGLAYLLALAAIWTPSSEPAAGAALSPAPEPAARTGRR